MEDELTAVANPDRTPLPNPPPPPPLPPTPSPPLPASR